MKFSKTKFPVDTRVEFQYPGSGNSGDFIGPASRIIIGQQTAVRKRNSAESAIINGEIMSAVKMKQSACTYMS